MTDMINNPPHYTQGKYEVKDIIHDIVKDLPGNQSWLVANIIKYMARYYYKNGLDDVKKARFYINELVKVMEKADGETKFWDSFRVEVSE